MTVKSKQSKLPLGPAITKDKAGRNLFWFNRKRVKEDVYWAEVDLLRQQNADRAAGVPITARPDAVSEPPLVDDEPDRLEAEQLPPEVELVIEQADDGSAETDADTACADAAVTTADADASCADAASPDADAVIEKLDQLLGSLRDLMRPGTTFREHLLLSRSCLLDPDTDTRCAHYRDVLEICEGNPQSANALLGSLIRKGLVRYESKEEARYRLITTTDRFFARNSAEVQSARAIEPTGLGLSLVR